MTTETKLITVKKSNKPYSWMYGSKDFSDIELRFKDGTTIPAHKLILSTWSLFFKTMFVKDPEKQGVVFAEASRDVIDISDENHAIAKTFIEILYELPEGSELININNLFEVFKMSQFYQSDRVTELCLQRMERYLESKIKYLPKPFCLGVIEELKIFDPGVNCANERMRSVLILAASKLISIIDSSSNSNSINTWLSDVDYGSILFIINIINEGKINRPIESNDSLFHFIMAWGIMHFMMMKESDPTKLGVIMGILKALSKEGAGLYGLICAHQHAKEVKLEDEKGTLNAEIYTKPLKDFFFAVYDMLSSVLLDRMIESFLSSLDMNSGTFNVTMWHKWHTWNQKSSEKRKESITPKKEPRPKKIKTLEQGNIPDSPNSLSDAAEEPEIK